MAMMKLLMLISLMAIGSVLSFAQNAPTPDYKISGRVTDSKNFPVPFANVVLYNSSDSVFTKGTATDNDGKFEISTIPGSYYLKVSFLSFQTKMISNIKVGNQHLALNKIILAENSELIGEVVVKGQKSQMQLNLDKKVFNVGSDITNLGGSAADVLNNVPSVAVEIDGSVTLRGSQNVRILVDGKPSGLVGLKSTDALRQLQGDIIERIEVITNPSARYDAAGEVGIINLILKKNSNKGLNGIFTANAGFPMFLGGSYSVNYRKNNLNFFSNYGVSYRSEPGKGSTYQRYAGADTSFIFNETSNNLRSGLSNNITLGLDYFFSEKSILTASFMYENSRDKNFREIEYMDYDIKGNFLKSLKREDTETANENNFEAALGYKKKFDRKDQELTMDFKWMQTTEPENSTIKQFNSNGVNDLNERSGQTEDEYNYLLQADYIHPFLEKGKLETGLKSNLRIVHSNYYFDRQDNALNWVTFPAFANNLIYTEKIHAGYLMSGYEFERFSMQAGLRGEFSDIKTELTKTNETNHRTYLDLFPSASLSYKLNDENTFQVSYSKRLNRPNFRDLMPFDGFGDSRILNQGNPDLNPEYTNSYEAGHMFEIENFNLLTTAYYRYRTGVIQRFSSVDSLGITHIIPINLSIQNAYGLECNLSYELGRSLRFNSNFNFYKAVTQGTYNLKDFTSETYSWTNRTSMSLKLSEYDLQTTLNYRAPRITPQGKDLASWFVDFGISRDVFKGNGTLALNVRDMFNSRKRNFIVDSDGLYSKSESQFHPRTILLTLTFRLNRDANEKDDEKDEDGGPDGNNPDF